MRYSVVLPRVDKSDTEAVAGALEQAHLQWEIGDHASALDLVRAASEAALAAGMSQRALALTKASAALGRQLEPGSRPPPAVTAAPPRAGKKLMLAREQPPARDARRAAHPVPSGSVPRPKIARAGPSRAPTGAQSAATVKPSRASPISAPPVEIARASAPAHPDALVVTVAVADFQAGLEVAVVGRRAERVVVTRPRRPDGTMEVRSLAPGEVAPAGSEVALLVSLSDTE